MTQTKTFPSTSLAGLALAIAAFLPSGSVAAQAAEAPVAHPVESRRAVREAREQARSRPVIGIVLARDADRGVSIAGVTPGSAGADAGLRTGDRLVAIDGHALMGSNGELRVVNARRLLAGLDEDRVVRLDLVRDGKPRTVRVTPRVSDRVVVWLDDGAPGIAPDIRREVARLAEAPMLLEAFRWNGLNLATVGTELGRYFGTSDGVLVLSAGQGLDALRPGDVIRKVGTTPVRTPRDTMDALRRLKPGAEVSLDVLRHRKPTTARITVPATLPALPHAPPAPPPPPAPPDPPRGAAPATPAAPPAPPAVPPRVD